MRRDSCKEVDRGESSECLAAPRHVWSNKSIWEYVTGHPAGSIAVCDGSIAMTYGELVKCAEMTAGSLNHSGVGRGDIVGVQLPNSAHLAVIILALARLGAVYHPLNPSYRKHDLARIFAMSTPAAYIFPREFRGFAYTSLAEDIGGQFRAIAVDLDGPPGLLCHRNELPPVCQPEPHETFLLGATSGSTAAPKLFAHSQITQSNEADVLNAELGLGVNDCFLAIAPITHRGAMMFGLMTAFRAGATLVVSRIYEPGQVVSLIAKHRVSAFMAIPTQVSDLLGLIENTPGAGSSLRVIMVSGAPVSSDLVMRLKKNLPRCTPVTGYGTSETGYSFFTRPTDDVRKLQTCGRVMPGMEAAFQNGEILLRGAFVFNGYHSREGLCDPSVDSDGWFHTGDLGRLDGDGYLIVNGRLKNVIIRAGLKIQAEEMEQILCGHPKIKRCLVIPVPDERLGQRAAMYAESACDQAPCLRELLDFLESLGVAKYKWPETLVIVEALPLNAVGKLDRLALVKLASPDCVR